MKLSDEEAAALGRAWVDTTPWAFLTALTGVESRLGGSTGEAAAAELVAEAFAEAGVSGVTEQSFPTQVWHRGECALERLSEARTVPTVALPYSPAGDVRAPLVDVGHGTPEEIRRGDVEGAVALAATTTPPGERLTHRMEKYGAAVDAGAVGFVFANHVPGQLPPTGSLRNDEEAPIPGVGVSKETGERLREYAREGGQVRLRVDAETVAGESQNVVGHLGPETERELLLLAHYDAHDVGEGALDNGCGVAVVVAAAALLVQFDLGCRVRVAAVGCEETGLVGSKHLASTYDIDALAGVVNVDGAGRFRDLVAMTHGSDATQAVAEAVAESTRHPLSVRTRPHPFSDHWPFIRRGVPALQLHADSGERGRGWTHTAADTLDKVDDRNVREHAMLAALMVRELAARVASEPEATDTEATDTDPDSDPDERLPRLDIDELRESLEGGEAEAGMRAAEIWPEEWD